MKKRFLTYCLILSSFGICNAQNLCDPTTNSDYRSDGFEFLTPNVGCGPMTIELEDKTGGSDIQYVYYYDNKTEASQLNLLNPTTDTKNAYLKEPETVVYTVLQYGKDTNGDDFYSCKNVGVRVKNEPVFSYTLCNNLIEIDIPENNLNDFVSYNLHVNGNLIGINKNQLPFSTKKNITYPITLKVEGIETNPSVGCPTAKEIVIPEFDASTNVTGKNLPFHPNIENLEMISGTAGLITLNGGFGGQGYSIYKTEVGTNYPSTSFLSNVKPGSDIPIEIEDSTKSYCFYAIRPISCGVEQSAEICTIPLNTVEAKETGNYLVWSDYKTIQFGFPNEPQYGRSMSRSYSILKRENGASETTINSGVNNLEYFDSIDCKKDYCYRIQVNTEGQLYYFAFQGQSISPRRCVSRKGFKPDSIQTSFVSIKNQIPEIQFKDDSNWLLNKDMFYLYLKDNDSFKLLDSTTSNNFLTDLDAGLASYCFKIGYKDQCGSLSKLSQEICSIFLEVNGNNQLIWNNAKPFSPSIINEYEIVSIEEVNGLEKSIFTKNGFDTTPFYPNLDEFQNEAFFYLKAINGFQESISNLVRIPIKTKLYIPNAFSPNNDNYNNSYSIFGSLASLSEFSFNVYNRIGGLVYEEDDPNFEWDGKTINGDVLPVGTYFYKLKAKKSNGETISRSGNLFILL